MTQLKKFFFKKPAITAYRPFPCTCRGLSCVHKASLRPSYSDSNVTNRSPVSHAEFLFRVIVFMATRYPISSKWLSPLRHRFKKITSPRYRLCRSCTNTVNPPMSWKHALSQILKTKKTKNTISKMLTLNVMLGLCFLFIVCLPRRYLCVCEQQHWLFTWTFLSICA